MGNRNRDSTPCVICGEPVKQDRSTFAGRETCNRKEVDGVSEKSECEKEKNRRYQKIWRNNNPVKAKGSPKSVRDRSVAISSIAHLTKHKAGERKRNCLKCGREFMGAGDFNRICDKCTVENTRIKPLRGV